MILYQILISLKSLIISVARVCFVILSLRILLLKQLERPIPDFIFCGYLIIISLITDILFNI